uniref:BTB domain-containing protein n=1 Tax=Aegilops tauschii subsp. strangulata TaxID=200361 RepID=A0A453KMX0_AEGTS
KKKTVPTLAALHTLSSSPRSPSHPSSCRHPPSPPAAACEDPCRSPTPAPPLPGSAYRCRLPLSVPPLESIEVKSSRVHHGPSDCEILPTRDSRIFHFRVRLSSPEGPSHVNASTVVAGCKCEAVYLPLQSSPEIVVLVTVRRNPDLEGDPKVSTHMVLLDKTGSPAPSMGTGTATNMDNSIPGLIGCYILIARRDEVKANCVVDNYFVVLCSVDINWTSPTSSLKQELPSLGHDLAMMWDKQGLTDVSFHVGGESFSAHRLVLATRLSVYRAELYGLMAESKMASITIHDMKASTFKFMLHYIYHGSLPDAGKADISSPMAQYQHLLVAADRYGVEGLKKICEDKLCCNGITTDTVVSMLELAVAHVCPKLKARCFDFLTDGDNFKMVVTSTSY